MVIIKFVYLYSHFTTYLHFRKVCIELRFVLNHVYIDCVGKRGFNLCCIKFSWIFQWLHHRIILWSTPFSVCFSVNVNLDLPCIYISIPALNQFYVFSYFLTICCFTLTNSAQKLCSIMIQTNYRQRKEKLIKVSRQKSFVFKEKSCPLNMRKR